MKYFFTFYEDKKGQEYIALDNNTNYHKTNKTNFNLKININDMPFGVSGITDYKLKLIKENGDSTAAESISGNVDFTENAVMFKECSFKDLFDIDGRYKLYLEFMSGGLIVYNGMVEPIFIDLRTKCPNYLIDIYNSTKVGEVYELQGKELHKEIDVTLKLIEETEKSNILMYSYRLTHEENIKLENWAVLGSEKKKFTIPVLDNTFYEGKTNLYIALKDANGNINNKKITIAIAGSNVSAFEIKNTEHLINSLDKPINIYFDYINVSELTPVLNLKDYSNNTKEMVSEKKFGLLNKQDGMCSIDLKSFFPSLADDILKYKILDLHFVLNSSKEISNTCTILFDDLGPKILITNLDANNYEITRQKIDYFKIEGKISDSNLFFVGNSIDTYNNEKYLDSIIFYAKERIKKVKINSSMEEVIFKPINEDKGYFTYISELDNPGELSFYNEKNNDITNQVVYIDSFKPNGEKVLFITFKEDELDSYEKNVIENQNGVDFGGELSTIAKKVEFKKFLNSYVLKIYIPEEETGTYSFTLKLHNTVYSLMKRISTDNISCKMVGNKEIDTDFTNTSIFCCSSSNTEKAKIIRINNSDGRVDEYFPNNINLDLLFFISMNKVDTLTITKNIFFITSGVESSGLKDIYYRPILKDSKDTIITYENYKLEKLDSSSYMFSMYVPISSGINSYNLAFYDNAKNKTIVPFEIEKNSKPIEVVIDKTYIHNISILDENGLKINAKEENVVIKFSINNESLKQKLQPRFLIIKNDTYSDKYKIITEGDKSYCIADIKGLKQEYENFEIIYELEDVVKNTFQIKHVSGIFLSTEQNFLSGMTRYYLQFQKSDFADIKLTWDNYEQFFCEIKDNIVIVTRVKDVNFSAKINIKLIAVDTSGTFENVLTEVKGIFYNNTIINNYNLMYDGKIQDYKIDICRNTFNISIESFEYEGIEYIYTIDNNENLYSKKNKYAVFNPDKKNYLLKDIITPLHPSEIKIFIKHKDLDFEIEKTLFSDYPIKLFNSNNKFKLSIDNKLNNKTMIKISPRNITARNTNGDYIGYDYMKEIYMYMDNKLVYSSDKPFYFSDKNSCFIAEFDNSEIREGVIECIAKVKDGSDKSLFTDNIITKLSRGDIELKLRDYSVYNLKTMAEAEFFTVEINGEEYPEEAELLLEVTDIIGNSKIHKVSKGKNKNLFFSNEGFYALKLIMKCNGWYRTSIDYMVDVLTKHIEMKNDNYLKIRNVLEISLLNLTSVESDILNARINHYVNGVFNNCYKPIILGKEMKFDIAKKSGLNEYFYEDNYRKEKLNSYNAIDKKDITPELLNFRTINNEYHYQKGKAFYINSESDISLTYKNVDSIIIKAANYEFKKLVLDNVDIFISNNMIPCKVEHYSRDNKKIEPLDFNIKFIESYSELGCKSIKVEKKDEYFLKFKIDFKYNANCYSSMDLSSKLSINHIQHNYSNSVALFHSVKEWMNLSKTEKNIIIRNIENELRKLNIVNEELLKRKIKEIIINKKWRNYESK